MSKKSEIYDLVIIGSGAAGLSAGIYAGRYLMKTLIIGELLGGEGTTAGPTFNYPGIKEIDGFDLMQRMKEQALGVGVEVEDAKVEHIKKQGHCFLVQTASRTITANTIILALGAARRHLGLPNEDKLVGHGVHYCATCDGPLYRNKTIAVVGGGDASIKGVNLIAGYVKKIYLIIREKEIIAEPVNLKQMKQLGDKVEVILENEVTKITGDQKLEKITLAQPHQGMRELAIDGLFIEIGAMPNVSLAKELGVTLDKAGYIEVNNLMRTNVDGVFACGDSVNHFGRFKQYITAAALGAVAATAAYEDHKLHGDLCEIHALPNNVVLQKKS